MKDISAILSSLELVPGVLIPFIQGVPKDRLHTRRGEGFWTIAEHVHHLDHLQPTLCRRVQNFLDQDTPEFVPYAMPQYGENLAIDVDQALAGFKSGRRELLELLRKAGPEVWKKQSAHPNYTSFDFPFMVRHILAHDYWHIYRIESLWLMKDEYLRPL